MNGNGSFAPMVSSTISSANFNGEWTDMVGDFNGDGKIDLVTVSTSTGGFIANVALGLGGDSNSRFKFYL